MPAQRARQAAVGSTLSGRRSGGIDLASPVLGGLYAQGMRAVWVDAFGGPEVYRVVEVEEPAAGAGQVVVQVAVSGLNFLDVYQRTGSSPLPPPFAAGVEGVGTIVALGDGVEGLSIGQRVGWLTEGQGSFADLVAVAADKTVPIPDGVDDATAVAVLMQGITAQYLATDTFPVQPGDAVLVHACAGGVGHLLSQIAKSAGATVLGTVSTPAKADVARSLGVDHVLTYEAFAAEARALTDGLGVSVVFDGVGVATFEGSLAAVRPRGMVVVYGAASGPVPPVDLMRLAAAGSVFLTRPTVVHYTATVAELRDRAADVFDRLQGGTLTVAAPTAYQLDDISLAFTALESRATTGKLLLIH
jgi:NADPH2:quinone reductase